MTTAALVTALVAASWMLRGAGVGRLHGLGESLGEEYVPRGTTTDKTLTLTLNEVATGKATYDPADPSNIELTVVTDTLQRDTEWKGTESVNDSAAKKLFDP